jgi:hypothetical protein
MSRLSSSEKWLAANPALLFVSYSVPKWANYPVGEWLASVHGSEDVSPLPPPSRPATRPPAPTR